VIVRLLLWSLADSATSLEEVRARLPGAIDGVTWLWHEASERFGVLVLGEPGDELAPALADLRALIGKEPELGEEFEAEP